MHAFRLMSYDCFLLHLGFNKNAWKGKVMIFFPAIAEDVKRKAHECRRKSPILNTIFFQHLHPSSSFDFLLSYLLALGYERIYVVAFSWVLGGLG